MRKFIVAGNWKMNTTLQEGKNLADAIQSNVGHYEREKFQLIVVPPYTHLADVGEIVDHERVKMGAQNIFWEEKGAYTGEISAAMVKSTGCEYVILGHSERRKYFSEAGEVLLKKVNIALSYDLKPIFCIGEELDQREQGKHFDVVRQQLEDVIFKLDAKAVENIIIAYEPVWAIGTGKVATPEQAQEMHAFIRQLLEENFSADLAQNITLLYGGSCKPSNARGLFEQPDIDGGLIGGASLKAQDFLEIFNILMDVKN